MTSEKTSADHILSRKGGGNLLAIIVGGAQEALDARPGAYKLLLRNRKGFIRLALAHGYERQRGQSVESSLRVEEDSTGHGEAHHAAVPPVHTQRSSDKGTQ